MQKLISQFSTLQLVAKPDDLSNPTIDVDSEQKNSINYINNMKLLFFRNLNVLPFDMILAWGSLNLYQPTKILCAESENLKTNITMSYVGTEAIMERKANRHIQMETSHLHIH